MLRFLSSREFLNLGHTLTSWGKYVKTSPIEENKHLDGVVKRRASLLSQANDKNQ